MDRGEYLAGLGFLAPTLAACALAGVLVVRARAAHLHGPARATALGLAISAAVVLSQLLPGALGALSRATALLAALLVLGVAALWARGANRSAPEQAPELPASGRGSWGIALAAAVAVGACAAAYLDQLAGRSLLGIDTTTFQVPTTVRFLESGSLWGLHQFIPDYSNATYPMHGNLLTLAVMLPFRSTFLVGLVAPVYYALAAVAAYGVAGELRAPRSTAVLTAACFAAVPVLVDVGLRGAMTDPPILFFLATAALFLLRHRRSERTADLVTAGVALGMAAGTKWYGLSYGAALLATWALAGLLERQGVRVVVRRLLVVAGPAVAAGGFWLLRNWVETGNPLFPVKVELAGVTFFDAPFDRIRALGGFALLHYAGDWAVWREYVLPVFRDDFAGPAIAFALGAGAAALLAARRPRRPDVLLVAGFTAALALAYLATPYTAFGPEGQPVLVSASTRYALPVLCLAAALTAWAIGRAGPRARVALEALLLLALADGLRRGFATISAGDAARAAAIVAFPLAAAWWLVRAPRPALVAGAAAALLLAVLAGDQLRERSNLSSYARYDSVYAAVEREAPGGARIAITGVWPNYDIGPVLPAYGARLGNDVSYLGTFQHGYLRQYGRPASFEQALRRGRYDLLIVGRGQAPRAAVAQEAWARASGYVPVADSRGFALLRAPRRNLAEHRSGVPHS